jgi:putative oxidoreductase
MFSWLDRFQPFGALLLRLMLGVIMVAHGYSKIIPRGALYNFTHFVATLGMPSWLGYVAAFTEFFGGMLLIVGLLTRIAALGLAIDMAVAILKVHLHGGLTGHGGKPGFEFPLALLSMALMLLFSGPGRFAADDKLGMGSSRR